MIKRKQVGDAERYHGRRLFATYLGPDLLANVNDIELPTFFLTVEAALSAALKYVDEQIKEATNKAGK